jgi:ribulose 1,5-bisphosphate carboxylase large subunit-like protein
MQLQQRRRGGGCLKDVAENEDSPASARVSAAKTILEMAMKAVELDDVIRRLDELEKAIEARKGDLN